MRDFERSNVLLTLVQVASDLPAEVGTDTVSTRSIRLITKNFILVFPTDSGIKPLYTLSVPGALVIMSLLMYYLLSQMM